MTWQRNEALGARPVYLVGLPAGDAKIILASVIEGLLRSTDAGATWELTDLPPIGLRLITAAASRPERVYAISTWVTPGGDRLWVSKDSGKHWSIVPGVLPGLMDLAFDPTDPYTVYAATAIPVKPPEQPFGGVYKSIDGGDSWTQLDFASTFSIGVSDDGSAVYRARIGGLWKSTDAGRNWINFNPVEPASTFMPVPPGAIDVPMLDPMGSPYFFQSLRARGNTLYACLSVVWFSFGPEDIETYGVIRWADGKWRSMALALPQSCDTLALADDPGSPGTIYAGGNYNLQRSWDGGESWTAIPAFNGLRVFTVTTEERPRGTVEQ